MQTDNVIQTYGPFPSELRSAFLISRTNNPDGSGTFYFTSRCDNIVWGCQPTELELRLSFRNAVMF